MSWRPEFVDDSGKRFKQAQEKFVADIPNAASGFKLNFLRRAKSWPAVRVYWLRDDGGGNWYRSEQSCFVIARDLRSLAPSRASTCKTSWIDRSLF